MQWLATDFAAYPAWSKAKRNVRIGLIKPKIDGQQTLDASGKKKAKIDEKERVNSKKEKKTKGRISAVSSWRLLLRKREQPRRDTRSWTSDKQKVGRWKKYRGTRRTIISGGWTGNYKGWTDGCVHNEAFVGTIKSGNSIKDHTYAKHSNLH